MKRLATIGALAIGLVLAGCGGGDEEATTTPAPTETPGESAPPTGSPGALPPEFVQCMADRGFDVSSPDDIHEAPPQVLQACFGSLHEGGAAP
jgi:hypothetical protein